MFRIKFKLSSYPPHTSSNHTQGVVTSSILPHKQKCWKDFWYPHSLLYLSCQGRVKVLPSFHSKCTLQPLLLWMCAGISLVWADKVSCLDYPHGSLVAPVPSTCQPAFHHHFSKSVVKMIFSKCKSNYSLLCLKYINECSLFFGEWTKF